MKLATTRFSVISTFLVFALYLYTNGQKNVLYADAGHYWYLSTGFYKHFSHTEHFSVLNFRSPTRGYLFPLTLFPGFIFCHLTGVPAAFITKLLGVFWATSLFAWIVPRFWQNLTGRLHRQSVASFAALLGFVAWSWGEYFSYPLTDFPALAIFLLALLWLRHQTVKAWLLAGLAFAAALNFRPIYVAAIPGVVLLILYELYRTHKASGWRLLGFSVGISLILAPQLVINAHNFHSYSPLVLGRYEGTKTSLYQWHLAWGMRIQRYNGYLVGATANSELVVTADALGQQLLQQATGGAAFTSMQQYAGLALKHPLDFTLLFARRLFHNLDIRYPSPYLTSTATKGTLFTFINFSVIFLGLILLKRIRRKPAQLFQLLALLAVVAAALPLVVEPRYIMPLHLLLATAATCGAAPHAWWRLLRTRSSTRNQLVAAYCLWMLACLIISQMADAQTHLEKLGFFH